MTSLVWLSVLFSALVQFVQSVNILCSDPIHYGTLELLIKQAEIPNNVCDLESECDLFVKIYVDGNFIGQSRTNMNSNKPLFNEYFKIESVTNVSTLRLIVMDEDRLENMGSDLQDENDEIFEIFLRIDEDILNENRNGKQMEVDGYSLKGIGAMGRLVFGIHWDNKFASCDFEQGSCSGRCLPLCCDQRMHSLSPDRFATLNLCLFLFRRPALRRQGGQNTVANELAK